MKDTLYLFTPGFDDAGTTYFCPYSAQVIGLLAYYPEIRDSVDVVELGFAKPRRPLSDVLGEAHQAAPMLVLAGDGAAVAGVTIGEANGHRFVEKTIQILRYLTATRGLPLPH